MKKMADYLQYVWSPLCFIFAIFSYYGGPEMCAGPNCVIVDQMWFMWLIMGLMSFDVYLSHLTKREK